MDATQYMAMARRWWWLLIVGTVIAVAAYGVAARIRDQRQGTPAPTYRASATFFVSAAGAPDRLTQSYAAIITGRGVAERIVRALGLQITPEEVRGRLSVSTPPQTQLIYVTAKGASADDAQRIIDGVAQAVVALRQEGNLPGSVTLVEVDRAERAGPTASLSDQLQIAALVAVFGLLGAASIIVAFEFATDAVRDRADAERATGLPALGSIPAWNAGADGRRALPMLASESSAVAERFRMLRTAIGLATREPAGSSAQPARAILFAGAAPGAGTTTVAANVAAALAQAGRRVALLDADLRRPSMHRIFGIAPAPGLADMLTDGGVTLDDVMRTTAADRLTLVRAGAASARSSELIDAPRFDEVLRGMRERFDIVIVDAPPALWSTDATLLAAKCDATVVVARGDVTRRREAAAAVDLLRPASARMLGVVLNADANVPGGGFFGFRVRESRPRQAEVRA